MAWELWNKYEEEINVDFQTFFDPINSIQDKIDKISLIVPDNLPTYDEVAYTLYWTQIERYFIQCNGGVGYDNFIAKRFLGHMLLYWLILSKKSISNDDVEKCCVEIETAFYVFLNCIYNIKEKWHAFLNTTKEKNDIIFSTLNSKGKDLVLEKLNLLYNDIKKLCYARTYLVHDVFHIRYNRTNALLNIGRSDFTLSEENLWKTKSSSKIHQITVSDALNKFVDLENHRYELLNVLSTIKYVDINKLKGKYLDEKRKQYTYTTK